MQHRLVRTYLILGGAAVAEAIFLVSQSRTHDIADQAGLKDCKLPKELVGDPAVALATLLLVIATFALFWATRSLVKGADRNAEMQLRAYILVETSKVGHSERGFAESATVVIKNFGQTPARHVVVHIRGAYCAIPATNNLPDDLSPYEYKVGPPFFSGPGMKSGVLCQISNTESGRKTHAHEIFVQGVIAYEDAFSKTRRTEFCLQLVRSEAGERFIPWTVGNDAT